MKKIFMTLLMAAMLTAGAKAQQAITFAGGDVSNAAGSISFSCGEVAVQRSVARAITVVNITSYFTEGVQQGFATSNNSISAPLPVKLTVSPNPTPGLVEIAVADGNHQGLHYTLYSLKGEKILNASLDSERTQLNMSNMSAGTYILHVENAGRNEKNVYKIIKAN